MILAHIAIQLTVNHIVQNGAITVQGQKALALQLLGNLLGMILRSADPKVLYLSIWCFDHGKIFIFVM